MALEDHPAPIKGPRLKILFGDEPIEGSGIPPDLVAHFTGVQQQSPALGRDSRGFGALLLHTVVLNGIGVATDLNGAIQLGVVKIHPSPNPHGGMISDGLS